MPSHLYVDEPLLDRLRTRLLRLGLPLVLKPRDRLDGLVARTAPALLGISLFLLAFDISAAVLQDLTPEQMLVPTDAQAIALGGAALLALFAPVAWWLLNLVLRRLRPVVGTVSGFVLLACLVALPWAGPSREGVGFTDVLLVVAVLMLAAYWGVGTMTAWAFRRAARELNHLGHMVGRVLPILMLALLFSFFNAELWQVVAQISIGRTWAIVGVMALLGLVLASLNARDEISGIIREYDAQEGGKDLRVSERINITVMCVLISLIQVTLLGVVVFLFYVVFGVLSVSPTTATQWIGSPPEPLQGAFASLPVTEPLVKACLVLSAFSALNFVVSIGTDASYRTTFLQPALDEVRQGLEVRDEYTALLSGKALPAASGVAVSGAAADGPGTTTGGDVAGPGPAAPSAGGSGASGPGNGSDGRIA